MKTRAEIRVQPAECAFLLSLACTGDLFAQMLQSISQGQLGPSHEPKTKGPKSPACNPLSAIAVPTSSAWLFVRPPVRPSFPHSGALADALLEVPGLGVSYRDSCPRDETVDISARNQYPLYTRPFPRPSSSRPLTEDRQQCGPRRRMLLC